ncbi:MFS transporter [Chloroflexota bacterium]
MHIGKSGKPRFFYGYVIVAACFLMMVVWWGTHNSFGVFFESLLVEFGWTRAMTAGALSLNTLLFALLGIIIARLCDRFGPRIVIGACGLPFGLGYSLLSQVNAIWQLYLLYGVLIAIGMGAYIAILPIVAKWFVKRRGLMTGVVFSGMGLGTTVFPPIVSWLIYISNWRFTFIVMGIVALVGIVLGAQFLMSDPRQLGQLPYGENAIEPKSPVSEAQGFSFQEAIHTRQFWLVCGMYFNFLVCLATVMVHIVIQATGIGVSVANAANILAIVGALSIVGMNTMGMAGDKFGNKSAFVVSFLVMTLAFLWVLLARETWMFYLFAAVFGFAYGGMQVLFSPMMAELFGLRSHGIILATAAFAGGVGAAVGPVLSGYIFDVTSSYSLAFIICAILSAIAFILTLLLRPPRREG